jgi:uncharacterized protein YxjI
VSEGHATDGAGRQDLPPVAGQEVLGDLAAGLAAADHQHRPVRELVGTAVVGGVVVGNPVGEGAGERRDKALNRYSGARITTARREADSASILERGGRMYLIRERFFRLGEDSDITDEHGRPVLQVDGKVLSLRNRLVLRDPEGRELAQVQRKLVAMRPTYQISVAGQEAAEVRKRLFTPFGDRFTIDVPGPDDLEMTGDLLDHEFTIRRGDQVAATVSKRWFSVRDTYAVEVAAGQDDLLILASVLALDLAEDQERSQH